MLEKSGRSNLLQPRKTSRPDSLDARDQEGPRGGPVIGGARGKSCQNKAGTAAISNAKYFY